MIDQSKKTAQIDSKKKPNTDKANCTDTIKKEYGGRKNGLDPTRYGDWEKNGRCIDF